MVINELLEQAQFSSDSPVFKPLTTNDFQKQTLISLKAGQILSNHKSHVESVLILVKGKLIILDGQVQNEINPGTTFEPAPQVMTKIEAKEDSVILFIQTPNPKASSKGGSAKGGKKKK